MCFLPLCCCIYIPLCIGKNTYKFVYWERNKTILCVARVISLQMGKYPTTLDWMIKSQCVYGFDYSIKFFMFLNSFKLVEMPSIDQSEIE